MTETAQRKRVNEFLDSFDNEFISAISPKGDAYLFSRDEVPLVKFEIEPVLQVTINSDAPIAALVIVTDRLREFSDIVPNEAVCASPMVYDYDTKTVMIGQAARHYKVLKEATPPQDTELN